MADPWANVDGSGPEFLELTTAALETRGEDPQMIAIIERYLEAVPWPGEGLTVEIGCGSGAVTQRVAAHAFPGRVLALDPSEGLIAKARETHPADNIEYRAADGAALPLEAGVAAAAVLHTVLSHVARPEALVSEAVRILRPGGSLAICDADFSKLTLAIDDGDPLGALAEGFRRHAVTQLFLTARLRAMVEDAGMEVTSFEIANRVTLRGPGTLAVVQLAAAHLVTARFIGKPLAEALAAEYWRRESAGVLYGFLPFVSLIARKPD